MGKLLVANWKMNCPAADWKAAVKKLAAAKPRGAEIVICPPFVCLEKIAVLLKKTGVKLGAQDVFWENNGAYTGEISAEMLLSSGAEYAIIGHSERRRFLGETDEMINKKVLAALKAGLKVILCVGEGLPIRRRGKKAVEKFVKSQLEKNLSDVKRQMSNVGCRTSDIIIAYEPVWAIGTGTPDTPADAVEMAKFIKKWLMVECRMSDVKVLYGGSVNGKNAGDFINRPEIDGALVGGASLKPPEFMKIAAAAGTKPFKKKI